MTDRQFAPAIEGRAILRSLTCSDGFGNVLLDSVLLPLDLECATHVPTTQWHENSYYYDVTLLRIGKHVIFGCRQKSSGTKNDA